MSVLPSVRDGLVYWLQSGCGEATIRVVLPAVRGVPAGRSGRTDDSGGEYWTVDEVLHALCDDEAPVAENVLDLLGLPAPCSFGQLARVLLIVREDEDVEYGDGLPNAVAGLPQFGMARPVAVTQTRETLTGRTWSMTLDPTARLVRTSS